MTDKNHADETVLTIVQGKGTLPREQAGRNIHYDNASLSNYKMVQKGDFIIHLRSFEGGLEIANENGIVSPAYTILRGKKPHSSRFYEAYFHTDEFINHVLSKSVEGIRDGRQISYDAFKWLSIPYCNPNEQEKIADLFSTLSRRIEKQSALVDSLKKYKRGLSDTLFAHIVQRSDCQIMNLGEVFELLQNNTFSREELTDIPSSVQNIHYGDVLIKYRAIVNIVADKPPYIKPDIDLQKFSPASYLCDGDIVFADTAEDYSVGKAIEITGTNGQAVLSGLHTIPCRPLVKFHPMYLGFYFNSSLFRTQIYPLVQGTKVSSISKGELVKASVHVPTLEEQKKIALLLYSMDYRIALEEKKSSDLITARAALLQQLFI